MQSQSSPRRSGRIVRLRPLPSESQGDNGVSHPPSRSVEGQPSPAEIPLADGRLEQRTGGYALAMSGLAG